MPPPPLGILGLASAWQNGTTVPEGFGATLSRWTALEPATHQAVLLSLILILVLVVIRAVVVRVVTARIEDIRAQHQWRKVITYAAVLLGVFIVGRIWYAGIANLATFLGLVTAGLAIALRDPVVNLGGWLYIVWSRPFVVGDRIQIGSFTGDVLDKRLFQIAILEVGNWVEADQSTGRMVHIPNGLIFREPLANYTRGLQFLWDELPIRLTFESNWQKAKALLAEIVERHASETVEEAERQMATVSRQHLIFYSTLTPAVYTSVREFGVLLTLRYLCHPRRRRGMAQAIWEDVLETFGQHDDIAFGYPTIRYFDRHAEGATGPPPLHRPPQGP